MYSNQFTNTKNSAQAQSLHKTDAFHGYMLGKNQKIPPKSFYKNDMRYIIPYSFSQQNEFYKVYNTKQEKQNKITVPQTACTARVPCGYLQDLASSRPATGHGPRAALQWLWWRHGRSSFYSQVFTESIPTGKFL